MKILLFFFLVSCAKFSYLVEQGKGQLKLQWRGKKIEEVLSDPSIGYKVKNKLKLINTYKKYFYEYFDKEETSIYSKVTFLDSDAVTYLVIASYYDEIEPLKTSFPFVGSFPYLGFFNEESAKKYQKKLEKKNYFTYKRPVYAYSTLGKLEDRVLSSFFQYSDKDLAELIFHELFHTIFFVKSNVDLNENLANYFGKELMKEYFSETKANIEKKVALMEKNKSIRMKLVELINDYKLILKNKKPSSKQMSEEILEEFLKEDFKPQIEKTCKELVVENCYPLKSKWNNASFAAFMTYEKKGDFIKQLREKHKIATLKDYYYFLEQELIKFDKSREMKNFTKHLENLL